MIFWSCVNNGAACLRNTFIFTERTVVMAAACKPSNSPKTTCNWPISSSAMLPSAAIMYNKQHAKVKWADSSDKVKLFCEYLPSNDLLFLRLKFAKCVLKLISLTPKASEIWWNNCNSWSSAKPSESKQSHRFVKMQPWSACTNMLWVSFKNCSTEFSSAYTKAMSRSSLWLPTTACNWLDSCSSISPSAVNI